MISISVISPELIIDSRKMTNGKLMNIDLSKDLHSGSISFEGFMIFQSSSTSVTGVTSVTL